MPFIFLFLFCGGLRPPHPPNFQTINLQKRFFTSKMYFLIFGRFLNELGLLVVTEEISTTRSPRIMVQIVKILLRDPFYDLFMIYLYSSLRFSINKYIFHTNLHFSYKLRFSIQNYIFHRKRPRSGPQKTPFILQAPIAKTLFCEIVGGVLHPPRAYPPPMISPKSVFARGSCKINVGVVDGAPL